MKKTNRLFIIVMLALIFASATYAFAAANTVPVTGAGDGAAAISGYTVGIVSYALDATDPDNINTVTFTLTPLVAGAGVPTTVRIQLVSGGAWFTCTGGVPTWSCGITGVTVLAANNLRVVAAQ